MITPNYVAIIEVNMNDIKDRINLLNNAGWTYSALADELQLSYEGLRTWRTGIRNPRHTKAILMLLDNLSKRKRIPPKRRYIHRSTKEERR